MGVFALGCLSGRQKCSGVVLRRVPGVVLRHVPGVVRIMFRGLCGLYSTLSLTGRSAGWSARASYGGGLRHLKTDENYETDDNDKNGGIESKV